MKIFIYSNSIDRYSYHISKYFTLAGHTVRYKRDNAKACDNHPYIKAIYDDPAIEVVIDFPKNPKEWLFIIEKDIPARFMNLEWGKIFCWNGGELLEPMSRHQKVSKYLGLHFTEQDKKELPCQVLNFYPHPNYFLQKQYYNNRVGTKKELFAICSLNNDPAYNRKGVIRLQLLEQLRSLGDKYVFELKRGMSINDVPNDKIILNRYLVGDGVAFSYVGWLDRLAKSKFNIVLPGFGHKDRNHRSAESFFVGTVPVMTHGEMFNPELTDKEAILYNVENFKTQVKSMFDKSDEEIQNLINNGQKYWRKYLEPHSYTENVLGQNYRGHFMLKDYDLINLSKDGVMIELGTERGAGSTYSLAIKCANHKLKGFYTVDIIPAFIKRSQEIMDKNNLPYKAVQKDAVEFMKDVEDKISVVYMDFGDVARPNHKVSDNILKSYRDNGFEFNQENVLLAHLECAKEISKKMVSGGIVVIDDVWEDGGAWDGKGKYSIPYFLSNGFEFVCHKDFTVKLRKK